MIGDLADEATKVALNLDYRDTWTLWADIRCLFETVRPRRAS